MHEIITLQLGQESNYLATHFWNAQESYFTYSGQDESPVDHDVHWRPGMGADGSETFMPRTVIYDLKGGFGSLRQTNALYELEEEGPPQGQWGGQTVVHRQTPIEPSPYQQSLDAGTEPPELTTSAVRYWSDFNRVFFHPRSIVQLNDYELNSTLTPFEKWQTGEDLFASLDKEHDIVDRDLRPFVEEADQMQGIQVMATTDDAWGGFAGRYLERLRDEYGKVTIWVFGLQTPFQGANREKRLIGLANKARTLTECYKQASLTFPIALPRARIPSGMSMDPSSSWHSSALLATGIESATLPSRLKAVGGSRETMGGMTDLLNTMGKQTVANLDLALSGENKVDLSNANEFATSRSRASYKEPSVFGQVETHRGETQTNGETHEDETSNGNGVESRTQRYNTRLGFPLLSSFPRIFRGSDHEPLQGPINLSATLKTDSSISDRLKSLRTTVSRSIGVEERESLTNDLAEMADEYHEGWSSGSDDGEDD